MSIATTPSMRYKFNVLSNATDSFKEALYNIDAKTIIAAILVIGYFILLILAGLGYDNALHTAIETLTPIVLVIIFTFFPATKPSEEE